MVLIFWLKLPPVPPNAICPKGKRNFWVLLLLLPTTLIPGIRKDAFSRFLGPEIPLGRKLLKKSTFFFLPNFQTVSRWNLTGFFLILASEIAKCVIEAASFGGASPLFLPLARSTKIHHFSSRRRDGFLLKIQTRENYARSRRILCTTGGMGNLPNFPSFA